MANVVTIIKITHDKEVAGDINNNVAGQGLVRQTYQPREECEELIRFFSQLSMGDRMGKFDVQVNNGSAVGSTLTLTIASANAVAGDTVIIGGVTFSAVSGTPTNNQFKVGASNTATATNLAAAINASTTTSIAGNVTAVASTNTVVVTAGPLNNLGLVLNLIQIDTRGSGNITVAGQGVFASGTFTFSGAATAGDTVLINGVTFTAETSGASGNQWNIGSSATQTAANLAAAINGSVTSLVSGYVYAVAASGVVTVSSQRAGILGNCITIAKGTDAGSVNTVSGARLTGGTDPGSVAMASGADASANLYKFGVS